MCLFIKLLNIQYLISSCATFSVKSCCQYRALTVKELKYFSIMDSLCDCLKSTCLMRSRIRSLPIFLKHMIEKTRVYLAASSLPDSSSQWTSSGTEDVYTKMQPLALKMNRLSRASRSLYDGMSSLESSSIRSMLLLMIGLTMRRSTTLRSHCLRLYCARIAFRK